MLSRKRKEPEKEVQIFLEKTKQNRSFLPYPRKWETLKMHFNGNSFRIVNPRHMPNVIKLGSPD